MIVRVSNLESFRYWRENEDAELEPLLSRLRGDDAPSPAMEAGTAFHKALETAQEGVKDVLLANGYKFLIECDVTLALPEIRELRMFKAYGPLTVTGQVDALEGKRIEDHKTTARFDADRYMEGYQWRFYLDLFSANTFRWNIFELSPANAFDHDGYDGKVYSVHGFHTLEQVRYPGLHADCAKLAGDYYAFASRYLNERVAA